MNINVTLVTMSAVAHIDKYMLGFLTDSHNLRQGIGKSVTIIRIAFEGHRPYKSPALARNRNAYFAPKFVTFMCLSLADTVNFRSMHTVKFVFVISLLPIDPSTDIQQSIQWRGRVVDYFGLPE